MMNKFGKELGKFLDFNNISIKEFAERIDTTPKNVNDIIKGNIELSNKMVYNISFVTNIPTSYIENVENNFKLDKKIDLHLKKESITIKKYINKFNYKEFGKLYDYTFTNERNDYSIAKDILKYLRISNPESLYKNDNSIFYKSKNDKPELLALWLERCYKIVSKQKVEKYKKENIDKIIIYIKKEASKNIFNEEKLKDYFNKYGIYLAIEDDLKGSKIRGAFKVLNDKPAIYITKKHKRYADIYFALLHELAHCKSDFNRAKNGSIISIKDQKEIDSYELKADKTALNWMVNDKIYNEIKINFQNIDNYKEVKSFLVYRLALDKIIDYSSTTYQKNNPIIETEL